MVDDESAIQLARQEHADAVVVASINGAKQQTSDGYNIIRVTVTLKALDVTTGEVFANVQDRDKTLSQGGADISDGISRAAIKAGGPAVDQLVQKIVKRFSGARDQFVVLMIRDVPLSTQDQIEDLLDELGWEYRISSQTGTYMEVEVFSAGDPTSIRRIFRKASQKSGLQLTPVDMQGSRVVFSGRS
jgi:imidazole glycerol phosphate synthase subunit HisF